MKERGRACWESWEMASRDGWNLVMQGLYVDSCRSCLPAFPFFLVAAIPTVHLISVHLAGNLLPQHAVRWACRSLPHTGRERADLHHQQLPGIGILSRMTQRQKTTVPTQQIESPGSKSVSALDPGAASVSSVQCLSFPFHSISPIAFH